MIYTNHVGDTWGLGEVHGQEGVGWEGWGDYY